MNSLEDIEFLQAELHKRDEEIEELKEKLKNAIIPKFKVGQKIYMVKGHYTDDFDYFYGIENFTIKNIHYHFKCDICNISYDLSNGLKLVGEQELFATKEEAEQKIKELQEEENNIGDFVNLLNNEMEELKDGLKELKGE